MIRRPKRKAARRELSSISKAHTAAQSTLKVEGPTTQLVAKTKLKAAATTHLTNTRMPKGRRMAATRISNTSSTRDSTRETAHAHIQMQTNPSTLNT